MGNSREHLLIRGTLGESKVGSGQAGAGSGGEDSCSFSDSLGL